MNDELCRHRLKHVDVPEMSTPCYQKMMRKCVVTKARRGSSLVAYVEEKCENFKENKVFFGGFSVSLASLVIVLFVLGIPTLSDSSTVPQVHADEWVGVLRNESGSDLIDSALQSSDLHYVSVNGMKNLRTRSNVALSSSVSFVAQDDGLHQLERPEFRVNVMPNQMVNSTPGINGGVQYVQFTNPQGQVVTLGINSNRMVVRTVRVDSVVRE